MLKKIFGSWLRLYSTCSKLRKIGHRQTLSSASSLNWRPILRQDLLHCHGQSHWHVPLFQHISNISHSIPCDANTFPQLYKCWVSALLAESILLVAPYRAQRGLLERPLMDPSAWWVLPVFVLTDGSWTCQALGRFATGPATSGECGKWWYFCADPLQLQVSTIDALQGGECDFLIFSATRSNATGVKLSEKPTNQTSLTDIDGFSEEFMFATTVFFLNHNIRCESWHYFSQKPPHKNHLFKCQQVATLTTRTHTLQNPLVPFLWVP